MLGIPGALYPPAFPLPVQARKGGRQIEKTHNTEGLGSENISMFFSNSIANKKGFLPRPAPFRAWVQGTGEAGGYNAPGLPELLGGFSAYTFDAGMPWQAITSVDSGMNALTTGSSGGTRYNAFTFRASLSNTIYGASSTVMPPSVNLPVILYLGNPA